MLVAGRDVQPVSAPAGCTLRGAVIGASLTSGARATAAASHHTEQCTGGSCSTLGTGTDRRSASFVVRVVCARWIQFRTCRVCMGYVCISKISRALACGMHNTDKFQKPHTPPGPYPCLVGVAST